MFSRLIAGFASLVVLSPLTVFAQGGMDSGNVNVRVTYANGRRCTDPVRIQLMDASGEGSISDAYSNDAGMAEFSGLRLGNYHVLVSGDSIDTADSGTFNVDARKVSQFVYVTVKKKGEDDRAKTGQKGPSIAAVDLNIPDRARKEFDKASDLIAKQNWKKAIEFLKKALDIYPKYAAAYNNLGVAYGKTGDRPGERVALLQAVNLNDRFAAAYVNLAKMDIVDHNFPEAESFLGRATTADPTDSHTVLLLANVQLLDQHYDEVISNCRKLHSSPQDPHALVHYIAARAFEHQNRPKEAFGELQTFLQEEPDGPRADAVRREITHMQASIQ